MLPDNTSRKLADMTDQGAFERLATSILRQSDKRLRSLSHPGVNVDGKTVKSPVDGIAFVLGAVPPHMIAVHHTTCAAKDLEKKWLHNPATVRPRGNKQPSAPAGDVIKTLEIVEKERQRIPDLKTTLILTTNQEPGEALVRDVHAAGVAAGIEIDIWARSRLVDELDNEAWGQWLRRQYFGTEQVQLSAEMLDALSNKSLRIYAPPDQRAAWVERSLDSEIQEATAEQVVFIIASSGAGKTIACYKQLLINISAGGFSLILTDELIASAISLEQAVEKALIQLHPSLLAGCGRAALELASLDRRLLLAVEDINRSGRGAALIEKIARWQADRGKQDGSDSWRLLCPVWPQVIASLRDEARRQIGKRAVVGAMFSAQEGAEAVSRRYALTGHPVTKLEAARLSAALGHDPLLIALHDPANAPDPAQTLTQFIENGLQRLAAEKGEYSAAEYRNALARLAQGMLLNRELEPGWIATHGWTSLAGQVPALRHLAQQGEIVRLVGLSTNEKLAFRHDRVRELLLARATLDMMSAEIMSPDVAAEPYYAEIFGLALAQDDAPTQLTTVLASHNPLALFCSLRHFRDSASQTRIAIVAALGDWLRQASVQAPSHCYLRWEAMRALAEAEGQDILALVAQFDDQSWNAWQARYRNGDLGGGIILCQWNEPGVNVAGQEIFFDHVKARYGVNLICALVEFLERPQLTEKIRVGALRLAGHIGEPSLADAIRSCWHNHKNRHAYLKEYLWACAQCIDDDPDTLLGPICDGWAALPDTAGDNRILPARDSLAAHELRWAFRRKLPAKALKYFIERAASRELNWPITYMLHGVDQPDAVEFVVRELAALDERLEGTNSYSHFAITASNDWERRQEDTGRAMSSASRARLRTIWQEPSSAKYLRKQAFALWTSTYRAGDIDILRAISQTDPLWETAVRCRLRLGDREAIPVMIAKLSGESSYYWWQHGRHIWSDDLTDALDGALEQRGTALYAAGLKAVKRADIDSILSELLMRLPIAEAEALLCKHWSRICVSHYYLLAALYIATPKLQAHAAKAIKATSQPRQALQHLSMRFGYRLNGHPGVRRIEQINAIVPYLDLLDELDIHDLWNACNEHGWYELRRKHLDSRLSPKYREAVYIDEARAIDALNRFLLEQNHWTDHWLDEYLKSGVSLDEIMTVMGRWLRSKTKIQALKVVSKAITYAGERRHLEILQVEGIEPADHAAAIIRDAEFGVKRRTLRT